MTSDERVWWKQIWLEYFVMHRHISLLAGFQVSVSSTMKSFYYNQGFEVCLLFYSLFFDQKLFLFPNDFLLFLIVSFFLHCWNFCIFKVIVIVIHPSHCYIVLMLKCTQNNYQGKRNECIFILGASCEHWLLSGKLVSTKFQLLFFVLT